MSPTLNISVPGVVVKSLVLVLLFSGFITNFFSFSSINLSTILCDLIILSLLAHLLLHIIFIYSNRLRLDVTYFHLVTFWLALLVLSLIKLFLIDSNPLSERILGLRNNLIYTVGVVYLPLVFRKEEDIRSLFRIFLFFSLLIVLFSIFQFVFSGRLPMSLLVLRGEGRFGFYGTSIVRPTALLGNTIIYSSFTIILSSYYLSRYIYEKKLSLLLIFLLITLANILTFTRATLVGIFIVLLVVLYLRYARLSFSFLVKGFVTLTVLVALVLSLGYRYRDTFIVQRVIGKEASSRVSNSEHINMIVDAVKYLNKKPLTGAGIGTQGPSGNETQKIITDGFWFQLLLENGLILGLLYFTFYLSCFIFAFRTFYSTTNLTLKQLCMAFVAFSSYFFVASFINSGFYGRINIITYWLFFGLLLAQYMITKKREYAAVNH